MLIKMLFYGLKKRHKRKMFYKNAEIGKNFDCTHDSLCLNPSGVKNRIIISDNCEICGNLIVDDIGRIKIGEYTTIRFASSIEASNEIIIDDHVIISNNVIVRDNNSHPTAPYRRIELSESGFESKLWQWKYADSAPIHIESNVWIGERAIIYKGVTVGKGSIVAGGSVVVKSVPPYSIIAGNPAKIVKKLL